MNYASTVLKVIPACKKRIAQLKKQAMESALNAFDDVGGNTYSRMLALAENLIKREALERYLADIAQILRRLPREYRAILTAVYVKQIPIEAISARCCVSRATVYRKLCRAKKCFAGKIDDLEPLPADAFGGCSDCRQPNR